MKTLRPLAALLLTSILLIARAPAADTPEDVVARQLAAMRAGDWDQFTSCMSESTLREFQKSVIDILTNAPESVNREQLLRTYFQNKSAGDLSAIKPAEFFALFMNGLRDTNPGLKESMAKAEGKILGHIDEGPDTAHVVTRMIMPISDGRMTKMDVTTLKRDGDTWKAQLKGDMQAVVNNLGRMLQVK